jgi:hypothetical protein
MKFSRVLHTATALSPEQESHLSVGKDTELDPKSGLDTAEKSTLAGIRIPAIRPLARRFTNKVVPIPFTYFTGDMRQHSWFIHYATSRKVTGSIPDEVIRFFNWPIPSCHIMFQVYSACDRNECQESSWG